MKLTAEEIEAGKTEAGGYTKAQLAEWGIEWPPPKGWKEKLLAGDAFEPYVAPPVTEEEEWWSRQLCIEVGDSDPDRIIGAPPLPCWRAYLSYARWAIAVHRRAPTNLTRG
jgi:hypothetical protein